jgi:LPS sulfotransferase NodH
VLTDARTGSTLLMSYLSQLAGVTALPEVLNHGQHRSLTGCREPGDVVLYVRQLVKAAPAGWVSLNIHPSHLAFRRMTATRLLNAFPDSALIQLYRNDLLAQLTSLTLARSTGQWDRREQDASGPARTTVHIDPDDFWRFREQRVSWTTEVEGLAASWPRALVLEYQQLAETPTDVVRQVARVLAVPAPRTLTERLHKQEHISLRERVADYDSLEAEIGPLRYVHAPGEQAG